MKGNPQQQRRLMDQDRRLSRRRGFATLWLILILPCIVVALCVLIEIANLWIARAELEDALEAAALAAVKEWGDNGGGDTFDERQIGLDYAAANTVRGMSVFVDDNYNPANPNDNAECVTLLETPPIPPILIFGAITDPDDTPHTFDATVTPSCGGCWPLLFDASSENSLQQQDAWGVNFLPRQSPIMPAPNLTVSRIVYDLLPPGNNDTGQDAFFDFFSVEPPMPGVTLADLTDPPVVSNSLPQPIITNPPCAGTQPDVAGIDASPLTAVELGAAGSGIWSFFNSQIEFRFDTSDPSKLTVFFSSVVGDDGFEPGDRFRFGAKVENLNDESFSPNNSLNDGDEVGRVGVQVDVTCAILGVDQIPSSTATFIDSGFGNNANPPVPMHIDCGILANYPYILPDAPASGRFNDDQSYAELAGGGGTGDPFAVHGVGKIEVDSICLKLFGLLGSSFPVSARATAMYDCENGVPQLIRIDELICP